MSEYARVVAWPIADRRQLVHLAPADEWRIIGATLCGHAIKQEAGDDDGEQCERCNERAWANEQH